MNKKILVIDDDHYIVNLLENFFKREGFLTQTFLKGKPALDFLRKENADVILCDIRLPDIDGRELLTFFRRLSPQTPVIMMTAYAEIRAAVECIKTGALEYVTKPLHPEEILHIVKKAIEKNKPAREKNSVDEFIVGQSPAILKLIEEAKLVAPTDMSVLIQGETGAGKEYIARLIHKNSKRKKQKFVAIDCGAIPRELAASELFGHVKGSFTGAISNKSGYFEEANGGTIFLDEIGNLSYDTQVKLLRAIQHKVITRVGDSKPIPVDVRIVCAANCNLLEAAEEGDFREDLYHRINEFKLDLPSLRERQEDILIFAQHFLEEANRELEKNVKGFLSEVKEALTLYPWHGNLRELRNVIKRSVLIAGQGLVTLDCLPEELMQSREKKRPEKPQTLNVESLDLKNATREAEKIIVLRALEKANNNKSLAARILKIDRKTLYNKISQLGIEE